MATVGRKHEGPIEIPYGIRWLVPKGERFANFDILNDNDTQLEYYRRFGPIYAVGIPTKKWRLVVVSDPALLDEVAGNETQFAKLVEDLNFFDRLQEPRGQGISVISDGDHYEKVRRVMLPWYSPQQLRTQLPIMKEQARRMVAGWASHGESPTDAHQWMERYALEVSGRGACNYDFGLLEERSGRTHAFAAAVPENTKQAILRVADPYPGFALFASPAERDRARRYRRQHQELYRTAEALVRARTHTCPHEGPTDLLSRLVTTPDPETGDLLDPHTIRDQVLMHLSNGFTGPTIVGAWLAYLLASHPDVEKKVHEEVDAITGGDPDYDLRYDDLGSFTYITQAIKETMRLHPPMPVTLRRSLKDGTLGNYRVRHRDVILVGALAAQRDPRYWGPEPDRFDPGNFAGERAADRPLHAFIPFSIGRRQCMAQEITYLMLRVVLFELAKGYRFRLAPGTVVEKNTVVTTKPRVVPLALVPRSVARSGPLRVPVPQVATTGARAAASIGRSWGEPTEVPEGSAFARLTVAYGSNFGACKDLAERFAERARYYGYSCDIRTLNDLTKSAPPASPSLLAVFTSTYTANPPSNATRFRSFLAEADPPSQPWRNCKFAVFGLGNSQWNAFLAFPRYVQSRLEELGAQPIAGLAHGDVGTSRWEQAHLDWNTSLWPLVHALSGAQPTKAAADRVAAEKAAAGTLTSADSNTAMARSLASPDAAPRVLLVPKIFTNPVDATTATVRVGACRELQAEESPKRTRHVELALPGTTAYRAGDHLGICPKNDEDRVEWLANRLRAALDGLFMVPHTLNVRVVPKGVVLQVRNVLTNLVDINARPTSELLELMLEMDPDPAEQARLAEIAEVLRTHDGPPSPLREAIDDGAYNVTRLLEENPACRMNIFEFLRVAQPLRPRYYSPSSSPRCHAGSVHLTVGLEERQLTDGSAGAFRGLSSGYVHSLREGDRVNVFLEDAAGFHLQEDVTKPMIFVSVGTGLAPMRAFLWERWATSRAGGTLGESALFNGVRSEALDYIYRDELEMFVRQGVLDHLHVVASRDRPGEREHVDARLRAEGSLVWRMLEAGGYVYVCGSHAMRTSVHQAFVDVVAEHAPMTKEKAEHFMKELEMTELRYRPDLWG